MSLRVKTATDLEAAGLPQAAARVLASKFEETAALAKKSAEDGVAARFDKLEAQMEVRFAEVRAEFRAEISQLRADMRAETAQLRADMQQSFRSLQSTTLTAIGIATGFLAVLIAALTLVLHYAH